MLQQRIVPQQRVPQQQVLPLAPLQQELEVLQSLLQLLVLQPPVLQPPVLQLLRLRAHRRQAPQLVHLELKPLPRHLLVGSRLQLRLRVKQPLHRPL